MHLMFGGIFTDYFIANLLPRAPVTEY